jgi:3'-5' exoribonuclease
MKEQYAAELEAGTTVDSVFAIKAREVRLARTGAPYLWLELADRTGSIEAVRFRMDVRDADIPLGSVARIRGAVTTWRGTRSVRVAALSPADSFDRGDLMPTTPQDTVALRRRLNGALASIGDRSLRALVRAVFAEPGFAARFAECPASESGHHACLGGLLEHTVAVVDSCERLTRSYPSVDRDLLVAAALVHDIGVVDALEFETSFEPTDRGRLLGHVSLGVSRLERAAGSADPAPASRRLAELSHAVAAHHAAPEAHDGPATLEALLLATADSLDGRVALLVAETARAARDGASWTEGTAMGKGFLVPHGMRTETASHQTAVTERSGVPTRGESAGGYLRAAG